MAGRHRRLPDRRRRAIHVSGFDEDSCTGLRCGRGGSRRCAGCLQPDHQCVRALLELPEDQRHPPAARRTRICSPRARVRQRRALADGRRWHRPFDRAGPGVVRRSGRARMGSKRHHRRISGQGGHQHAEPASKCRLERGARAHRPAAGGFDRTLQPWQQPREPRGLHTERQTRPGQVRHSRRSRDPRAGSFTSPKRSSGSD